MIGRPPRSPLFPYTTLFRSAVSASAFTAPHVTEFLQVDVTAMMGAVGRLRELPEFAGLRVSPLLLVAKATPAADRKSTRLNSSHLVISYAVFCLKKKNHSTP